MRIFAVSEKGKIDMLMTIGIIIAVATSLNALLILGIWLAAVIKEMKRKEHRQ